MKRNSCFACGAALVLIVNVSSAQDDNRLLFHSTFREVRVTSFAMNSENKHIAVGYNNGSISIVEPIPRVGYNNGSISIVEPIPRKFIPFEPIPAHKKSISAMAFSPDNKLLATGGMDGVVKLWQTAVIAQFQLDSQNRKNDAPKPPIPQTKKMFTAHTAGVNDIAFSPDGKRIATCGPDGTAKVWDADTLKSIFTIPAHKGAAYAVAFSPDGSLIATCGADKTAKIWKSSYDGAKAVFVMDGHEGAVLGLSFSPDGNQLATASGTPKKSGQVRVFNVETGKEDYNLGMLDDVMTTVCFHPRLKRLAAGGKDKKIRVFNTDTKKQIYNDQHSSELIRITFTADGGRLGSICADEAKYWMGSPKVAE